ncbi:hypothetical protein BFJ72_g11828 [Fusarium proliferatum]|uniref:Uncharacterized protein n=1 Tax=Gibberella intermedia TaxID=948311 RepID=A0A420SL26_GIBIN|nr:hypothetical protein BFJ72_g11828 [Fusarium proliferatum]
MPFPRILRLQDDKWNNPEDSIGTFIGYLRGGRYRCWEAAGPARQAFRELSPDIKDFLETSSIPPTDIVSWSIYMIGHNERNAAPKLLICSTDAKTRKNTRQLIKESKVMDKYPGIGLGDVAALPDRPVIKELSREAIEALLPFGCGTDGAVLADTSEPAAGKRIFVVNPHDFSLRPATTGPIIFHGDKCYQLTVAHAFRHIRELDHSFDQQMAEDDCDFDGMSDNERDDESQYDETTRQGSATPEEIDSDKASFMASFDAFSGEKHSSSRSESPANDHLESGNDPMLSVESLNEIPDFGEIDVSQLQFFGRLVLSSLTGSNSSLDYALIETSRRPENVEKPSMVTGSLVSRIGEIESDDISIVAMTSPRCIVEGRLTATPSYIRLPEQLTFQRVYPIRLGKPLQDGDCGIAVFGRDDDCFYGHIVAGGPGTCIAYLVPAGEISRDIQARFGFGLTWMPQQEGQGQHSKDDLQLSTGLCPDSVNSSVTSIKHLGIREPEEPPNGRPLEPTDVQQWLQHQPNSQPSQNAFINSQTLIEHSHRTNDIIDHVNDVSGVISLHTSSTLLSVNEWLQKSRAEMPSSDSPLATSGYKSYALRYKLTASVDPVQSATSLLQEAWVDATQETQRRTCEIPFSPSQSDLGSSNAQRDKAADSLPRISVLPQDFADASETCFFRLFDPERFSSAERNACYGRKEEVSHIITHAIYHHGLIRGRDPQYIARKYLASCQSSNPFVKAKGDCEKCSSLSKWNEEDFTDFTHSGVAICLRCWRKFDKKEMTEHMAGPLCDYNLELPKANKVWTLYTAFCSETQLPSDMALRKSRPRPSPRTIDEGQKRFCQDQMAAPADDLDATMSVSCPSLTSSTAGDSTELLHSPELSGSWVSQEEADDMAVDSLESNPDLQITVDAIDPLPLQSMERHQELKPKGQAPPYQQDKEGPGLSHRKSRRYNGFERDL